MYMGQGITLDFFAIHELVTRLRVLYWFTGCPMWPGSQRFELLLDHKDLSCRCHKDERFESQRFELLLDHKDLSF